MIAPPTFCRSLGAAIPEIKLGMGEFRGLDGGSDWEYFEPIRPGDRITVQSKIADLRESEGRLGPMVFITIETSYTNHSAVLRDAAVHRDSLLAASGTLAGESNMAKQTYYEDVEAGIRVPALEKNPTTQQLVKYAGASGDFYQIHYDKDFALTNNLPGVILHGALKNAFLGQLMTDFAGHDGWLRKLARAVSRDGSAGHQGRVQGQGRQEICRRRRSYGRLRNLAGKRQGRKDHDRQRDGGSAFAQGVRG